MDEITKSLNIGIQKLTAISEMAKILPHVHDEEEILQILEAMDEELEKGIAEIDELIDDH